MECTFFGNGQSLRKHVEPRRQGIPGFGFEYILKHGRLDVNPITAFAVATYHGSTHVEKTHMDFVEWKSIPYRYIVLTYMYAQAHLEKVCLKVLRPCPNRCDPTLQLKLPEVSCLGTVGACLTPSCVCSMLCIIIHIYY